VNMVMNLLVLQKAGENFFTSLAYYQLQKKGSDPFSLLITDFYANMSSISITGYVPTD
jgi:hypothetical protein